METIGNLVEDLLLYAKQNLYMTYEDSFYARNQLLELFEAEPGDRKGFEKELNDVLNPMIEYALEKDIIEDGEQLRFETKILGFVTPAPGLFIKNYLEIYNEKGSRAATDYLYNLSIKNKYIRLEDIAKNICWYADGELGKIGITINLSKPEKDAKQVLAERNAKQVKYPKCLLCLENLGFCGTVTHPARQTIRQVPVTLNGEKWHMQYSPYMYYDEHVIVFCDEHRPMAVTGDTFIRLLDFVDLYPNYFLGSNADLPIVGGSILSHDHYQGGKKVLPMFFTELRKEFISTPELTVGIRNWYNSVVTVKGTNKAKVLSAATAFLKAWREYTDESVGIEAYAGDVPHNTITPIARKEGNEYILDLILRNNRCDETHPDGIFHPTKDMHNIKKEGIGLIEAMGLFILPGRLKREINAMIQILKQEKIDFAALNKDEALSKHIGMLAQISAKFGAGMTFEEARDRLIDYVSETCLKILDCTAVFKRDDKGRPAFNKFVHSVLD